jgi:recombinational DNA repair protein (RecF pathway)
MPHTCSGAQITACARCGRKRQTQYVRQSGMCADCKTTTHHAARTEPEPLTGGRWVLRNLVWRWQPDATEQDTAA